MNYYDEEITISGPDSKHLSSMKIDRLPSGRGSATTGAAMAAASTTSNAAARISGASRARQQRGMLHSNSTDDDGLLQDIIDHDDDAEDSDDDDDDDSDELAATSPLAAAQRASGMRQPLQPHTRPQTRPGSTRSAAPVPTTTTMSPNNDSELDSDMSEAQQLGGGGGGVEKKRISGAATGHAPTADAQLTLTPEMWEPLPLTQEVKDLFPYILKYTPQTIETPYHLQPFIPEYVPAVGDVDAFLKVIAPPLLQPESQRANDLHEHWQRMGVYVLDEPSGTQSEPSLLNMKLRSVLTGTGGRGSGNNKRSTSAQLVPTAKSPKDIDKWIAEVEQVHMTQSVHETQPRRDIDALAVDWPRSFAADGVSEALEQAYQQCLQEQMSLGEYVRVLSQRFGIEGPLDIQADYILNVQTLFGLYLAANQAWD